MNQTTNKPLFLVSWGNKNTNDIEPIDIRTNRCSILDVINVITNDKDTIIFQNHGDENRAKYKITKRNILRFVNKKIHKSKVAIDVYRVVDENEKVYVFTIYITTMLSNNI